MPSGGAALVYWPSSRRACPRHTQKIHKRPSAEHTHTISTLSSLPALPACASITCRWEPTCSTHLKHTVHALRPRHALAGLKQRVSAQLADHKRIAVLLQEGPVKVKRQECWAASVWRCVSHGASGLSLGCRRVKAKSESTKHVENVATFKLAHHALCWICQVSAPTAEHTAASGSSDRSGKRPAHARSAFLFATADPITPVNRALEHWTGYRAKVVSCQQLQTGVQAWQGCQHHKAP